MIKIGATSNSVMNTYVKKCGLTWRMYKLLYA